MKKPLAPEIEVLIPNGIESFVPRCTVCTAEVPPKRRKSRSRSTCSSACLAVTTLHKKFLLKTSRCPSCWHPATPEERVQFREWRKSLNPNRRKVGRPKKPPEPETATCEPNPIDIPDPIS